MKTFPLGIVYIFEPFEGNPLNSKSNYSKVKVKNPDPSANIEYYSSFGEPVQHSREKGVDWIIFKTLNHILPTVEDHAKWRKTQKKKKPWFHLYPDDENKASPQFCILKRNFITSEEYDDLLVFCKQKFPKKEVSIKKKSDVSTTAPQIALLVKADPVPQEKKENEKSKKIVNENKKIDKNVKKK